MDLNRPAKLNAINQSMVTKIMKNLRQWAKPEDNCQAVIVKGKGKAFCAGGDVAAITASLREDLEPAVIAGMAWFVNEYGLNNAVASFPKPYIALMDGITMGGGVGISVHGSFRVATEKTVFAMPECDIGFFPDVAGTFFLPRLDGQVGTYLGLSSAQLKGYEVVYAGIATHYVSSSDLPKLEKALSEADLSQDSFQRVDDIINRFALDAPEDFKSVLTGETRVTIDRAFSKNTVEEILLELHRDGSTFALKTRDALLDRSPTSIKATLLALHKGKTLTFIEVLSMEYRLAERFMLHHDFPEGVYAKLVERRKPRYSPPTVEQVTPSQALKMVTPVPNSPSPDLPFASDPSFLESPHRFGLPSEADVEKLITGPSKVSREDAYAHFKAQTRNKKGVIHKVDEILARKTRQDPETKLLTWIP